MDRRSLDALFVAKNITSMRTPDLPTLVYHADWGTDPKKRWLCKAVLEGGRYRAQAPVLVGD